MTCDNSNTADMKFIDFKVGYRLKITKPFSPDLIPDQPSIRVDDVTRGPILHFHHLTIPARKELQIINYIYNNFKILDVAQC